MRAKILIKKNGIYRKKIKKISLNKSAVIGFKIFFLLQNVPMDQYFKEHNPYCIAPLFRQYLFIDFA